MMGLAEIVKANDDATNARAYQATLAGVYDKLMEAYDTRTINDDLILAALRQIEKVMEVPCYV